MEMVNSIANTKTNAPTSNAKLTHHAMAKMVNVIATRDTTMITEYANQRQMNVLLVHTTVLSTPTALTLLKAINANVTRATKMSKETELNVLIHTISTLECATSTNTLNSQTNDSNRLHTKLPMVFKKQSTHGKPSQLSLIDLETLLPITELLNATSSPERLDADTSTTRMTQLHATGLTAWKM
jgi:hypothetical protein